MDKIQQLTKEFSLAAWQVQNVMGLIEEGNTIPFIARYRKEQHGELDDNVLRGLSERIAYLKSLEQERESIEGKLEKLGVLDDALRAALEACTTLAELEDVYRPYRPKRRTRASIAREKGLEPLADALLLQSRDMKESEELAKDYINEELGVNSIEDALAGAKDIIAERLSDDAAVRTRLRAQLWRAGLIRTCAVEGKEDTVYQMYHDYSEPISRIAPHRVLAVDRGEREGFLKATLEVDAAEAAALVEKDAVRGGAPSTQLIREAAADAYARLLAPAVAREARAQLTERAQDAAIGVFKQNLGDLLMLPPVRGHVVLGMDPGIRTGCKLAVVDQTGKVLDTGVIYPMHSKAKAQESAQQLARLIQKHNVTLVSIGNGTASRETERFYADTAREYELKVPYVVTSEAGASVYSASKLASEELPQYDVTIRSAASIARRVQDPLAELVKIDPKSIGVGQYQHDMNPAHLGAALEGVVERCVNEVGVELNTASAALLRYVAGLNKSIAANIVAYREENGAFKSRAELLKVSKLGKKAFEQCAGFLRIAAGGNPLDATGVHPESYAVAEGLLDAFGFTLEEVRAGGLSSLGERVAEVGSRALAMRLNIGTPTLRDIVKDLTKPSRDPRDELEPPLLREDVMELSDLKIGMELKGTVRNVADFGAFVDIGVHRDGLVHVSELSDRRVKHPSEAVHIGDVVTVWVLEVDEKKKRISLSMRRPKQ
ncbi:MAG: Tex family protein [Bacillota bacterium]